MVYIYCAYTEPINPAGATPVLTRDQVWNGLQRKIRHAHEFVPMITGTTVLSEKDNVVVRRARFVAREGEPAMEAEEECRSYHPTKVDFIQTSGAVITNTISDGPGLTDKDLHMTYTFEWRHPEIQEGSEEHRARQKRVIEDAQMAVHKSIEGMRRLAKEGKLD